MIARLATAALLGALLWPAMRGQIDLATALGGALAGLLVLPWIHRPPRWRRLPASLLWGLWLLLLFSWEMVVANLQQARLVLSPRLAPRSAWLEYEIGLRSPALRALLGALVSLTPGTLTCEVGQRTLQIHVLDTGDLAAVRERIRSRLERPLAGMEGR
ncbi:MAG: Na+/H+ antiporter subunit E [Thermoanaerobaculia bacterium]|nr:Na+/H+ antiporter subunit E [Thermoanaerobaculia bacterium]MCZ7652637.1 Na+/H+ antiporter subunit E [Thermoanaerobaculia bacterium]